MFIDKAGVDNQRDEDEESEAIAPFDALILTSVGEVDNGGDEKRMIDANENQDGGAVNDRLILGI